MSEHTGAERPIARKVRAVAHSFLLAEAILPIRVLRIVINLISLNLYVTVREMLSSIGFDFSKSLDRKKVDWRTIRLPTLVKLSATRSCSANAGCSAIIVSDVKSVKLA